MNPNIPTDHQVERGRHWHYIYAKRRRRALGISSKQLMWSQVLSLLGAVVAGVLLESNKTTLALVTGVFVILPGIFDLNGTLGAALSAKINHRLEDPANRPWRVFFSSVGFALVIASLGGLLVATVGGAIAVGFFQASFWRVFWLAEIAVVLGAGLGLPLIGLMSVFLVRRRINPDDVVGPIESSIFDILTIISLALVIGWLI